MPGMEHPRIAGKLFLNNSFIGFTQGQYIVSCNPIYGLCTNVLQPEEGQQKKYEDYFSHAVNLI